MEDPYLAEILSKALNKDKTPEKSAKEEPLSTEIKGSYFFVKHKTISVSITTYQQIAKKQ